MRRSPTDRGERALKRGADELVDRAEWVLRDRPRALKNLRSRYRAFCVSIYAVLERAMRRRP